MKRTEIVKKLSLAEVLLENIHHAEVKNHDNGDTLGEITSSEIDGRLVGIAACKFMLLGVYEPKSAKDIVFKLLEIFGARKYDLDEDGFKGFESVYVTEDGEED